MNKHVQLQAHRGVAAEYPENTMAAFMASVAQGYDIIELDPDYTADGVLVTFHDRHQINRTARNADGSMIEKEIPLRNISYAEAAQYDYGIWFDKRFKGEKLPLLKDVFDFAEKNNIPLKLDNKIQEFPKHILENLFELCDNTNAPLGFTCNTIDFARDMAVKYPSAHIHYDGEVSRESLSILSSFVPRDRLTIWIAYPNRHTDWVRVPRASEELCSLIKQYGRLGIWIISDMADYRDAVERLDADVIETTGAIKPEINHGFVADMHTHSESSHDCSCPIADMALAQINAGTNAFAITDHCDIEHSDTVDAEGVIRSSYADAVANAEKYADKIEILRGVELGWYPRFMELHRKVASMLPYDVIIGSVHTLVFEGEKTVYSLMDFSASSEEMLLSYLETYFNEVYAMLNETPCDILAHLTCPLRYINGKYGRNISLSCFEGQIRRILEYIISHGIALEVNTSGLGGMYDNLMPDKEIIERYKSMGGYLITLASDAHVAANASVGFKETLGYLKKAGFENIYYYKNRMNIPCKI